MKNADLHIHSIYSDGELSPKNLVKAARNKGLKYIALTDHNCTQGIKEIILYGKKFGVEVIPGVEIASEWGEVLGYFIDPDNKELRDLLKKNRREIDKGARTCIKRLKKSGFKINYGDVKKEFLKYPLMCFFVSQFLIKKGFLKSTSEFRAYLSKNIRIKYNLPTTEQVVSAIKNAGGIPVLAHPFAESDYKKEFENIEKLIKKGLAGIEIRNGQYRKYDVKINEKIVKLAKKYGLILTSGSDFHGSSVKSKLGDCRCEEEVIHEMRDLLD